MLCETKGDALAQEQDTKSDSEKVENNADKETTKTKYSVSWSYQNHNQSINR